jgi:hypothetical protein
LDGSKVKLKFLIRKNVVFYIEMLPCAVSMGVFGMKYIEIIPGYAKSFPETGRR